MSKVLVIGDICEDVYIYGKCNRMSPAAPVPVFVETKHTRNLGMAGNVHKNLEALGVESALVCQQRWFPVKKRLVEEKTNHMIVRIDDDVKPERLVMPRKEILETFDAVIVSDYDKGALTEEDIIYLCENHPHVFVDTKKKISALWDDKAFCIKINEQEYERSFSNNGHYHDNLIVTLSESGCSYRGKRYGVEKVEVKDLAGAGDTFLAALVTKWVEEKDMIEAIKFANQCATQVVQQRGVSIIELKENK